MLRLSSPNTNSDAPAEQFPSWEQRPRNMRCDDGCKVYWEKRLGKFAPPPPPASHDAVSASAKLKSLLGPSFNATKWQRVLRSLESDHSSARDVHPAVAGLASRYAVARAWNRGEVSRATCPEVRTAGDWVICWPPVRDAIHDGSCIAYSFGIAG